jgi:hypothetical protein
MKRGNYDVLLLRPQDIAVVVDMSKAIDLVEQGYREAQDFPLTAPEGAVTKERENLQFSRRRRWARRHRLAHPRRTGQS